jgi:hypothetical protein
MDGCREGWRTPLGLLLFLANNRTSCLIRMLVVPCLSFASLGGFLHAGRLKKPCEPLKTLRLMQAPSRGPRLESKHALCCCGVPCSSPSPLSHFGQMDVPGGSRPLESGFIPIAWHASVHQSIKPVQVQSFFTRLSQIPEESGIWNQTSWMADSNTPDDPQIRRVAAILHEAGLSPPERIPPLRRPDVDDFEASLPSNIDAARSLLIQQRTSKPGYRPPDQQKRHILRSKSTKEATSETENWIFTKHEVAKAFDDLLSRTPLPVPGVAQALLSHASGDSLQELCCHFCDSKLEKKRKSRTKPFRSSAVHKTTSSLVLKNGFRRSSAALETITDKFPYITWLDMACDQGNLEYVRLMCQAGLRQDALNRAFRIALSKHEMDILEELLSFDVVASVASAAIRERVKLHDVSLLRLLLSAPNAMNVETWRSFLPPEA